MEFNGSAVLIVGACSSVGKAIALTLLKRGCQRLILTDKNHDELSQVRKSLSTTNREATISQTSIDIVDSDQVERTIEALVAENDEILYFVNCVAEFSEPASTMDLEPDVFQRAAHHGVRGSWICLRAQIRATLRQRELTGQTGLNGISIVNVASCLGLATEHSTITETAVNHAIIGMMRSVALDFIDTGVRVNCVCPGRVGTALSVSSQKLQNEEVANAVAFLLGPLASGINAVALPVDRGWSLYHR